MYIFIFCAFGIFSGTSGVPPMTNPDGSYDLSSIVLHITLLEHSMPLVQGQETKSANEIMLLKDELTAVKRDLDVKSHELVSVKSELEKLKTEYLTLKAEINVTDISSIRNDVHTIEGDIRHLETVTNSSKQTLERLSSSTQSSLSNVKGDVMKLQSQLGSTVVNISLIKSDMSALKQNVSGVEKISSNELTSVKSEVNGLKAQYLSLKTKLDSTDIDAISHDVKSNMVAIQNLEHGSQTLKQSLDNSNASVQGYITQLNHIAGNVASVSKTLQNQQKDSASRIWNISAVLSQVQTDLLNGKSDMKSATDGLRKMQLQMEARTKDIAAMKQNMSTLDSKNRNVAFSVYMHGQTGSDVPVIFSGITCNLGNGYSNSTGKFTAPVSGTYIFSVQVEIQQRNQRTYIHIKQSGQEISSAWGQTSVDMNDVMIPTTAIAYVRQGEEVWVESSEDVEAYGFTYKSSHFVGALLSVH